MTSKHRSPLALTLVLALLLALAAPALAAAAPKLAYRLSGSSAALTLQDLSGESIYGVQLDLTVTGSYSGATFTPAASGAYAPPCHYTAGEESTQITVYLSSQSPLNQGTTLSLGTLALPRSFSMPATAQVILLDRDLKPLEDTQSVVTVQQSSGSTGGSGSGGGGGGGQSSAASYTVAIAEMEHGAVRADVATAAAKDVVTLTVTPERGYALDTLAVTPAKGSKVEAKADDQGRYTFVMPASDVTISATFRFVGYLAEGGLPFTDVAQDAWYYGAVSYAYDKGMMNGTSETVFSPELTTSRAMLVTILYRLTGQPEAQAPAYPDVPAGQYYTLPVGWASAERIVVGYETGLFQPDSPITREQMATILYRYAKAMDYDVSATGDVGIFTDAEAISPYASEAMTWAVGTGLLSGMGDGTVNPGGQATRAQVATILMRFCETFGQS